MLKLPKQWPPPTDEDLRAAFPEKEFGPEQIREILDILAAIAEISYNIQSQKQGRYEEE